MVLALGLAGTMVGCGDLSPESEGTATVSLRLASDTHSPALLRQASRIADNASNRATVELLPVASCAGSPGNTGSLGTVAVTLGGTPTATFTSVPLGTALKLCVYLYLASTTSTTPDATGETDPFTISTENYANTILVGSTMRPLSDRFKVAREKLAYIVDATAAPVASLALVSTWLQRRKKPRRTRRRKARVEKTKRASIVRLEPRRY